MNTFKKLVSLMKEPNNNMANRFMKNGLNYMKVY